MCLKIEIFFFLDKRRLSRTPSQGGDFRKRTPFAISVDGAKTPKTKVFENADVMNSIISLPRRTKTLVWTRIFVSVCVGSKTRRHTKTD